MTSLNKNRLIIFLVIGLAITIIISFNPTETEKRPQPKVVEKNHPELVINETVFQIELADTSVKRQQGLSRQEMIADNKGMFFIFDSDDYWGIWMPEMNFSIDIIWLDKNLTVVDLVHNIGPETYPTVFKPIKPARYVLEIKAGLAEKAGIKIGSQASLVKATP